MLGAVAEAHSGNCLLYATLIAQPDPMPVEEETESQVTISISIVPSLSVNAFTLICPYTYHRDLQLTDIAKRYGLESFR